MSEKMIIVDAGALINLFKGGGIQGLAQLTREGSRVVILPDVLAEIGRKDDGTLLAVEALIESSPSVVKPDFDLAALDSSIPSDDRADEAIKRFMAGSMPEARAALDAITGGEGAQFRLLTDDGAFYRRLKADGAFKPGALDRLGMHTEPYKGTFEFLNERVANGHLSADDYIRIRQNIEADPGRLASYSTNAESDFRAQLIDDAKIKTLYQPSLWQKVTGLIDDPIVLKGGFVGVAAVIADKLGIIGDVLSFGITAAHAADLREQGDEDAANETWVKFVFETIGGFIGGALGIGAVKAFTKGVGGPLAPILGAVVGGLFGSKVGAELGEAAYKTYKELFDPFFDRVYDEIEAREAAGESPSEAYANAVFSALGFDLTRVEGSEGEDWLVGQKWGDRAGNGGDDFLVGFAPEAVEAGEAFDPQNPNSAIADREYVLTLDGGAGNDFIVTIGGEKAVTIGGNGRDWIFNTSTNGVLYGDTIDGRSPDGTDLGGRENSDNFWWWPSTTIMDARPNDVLKFFGFPLTGGTNNIPFLVSGALGLAGFSSAPGLVLAKSPLYFDNILVFMTYVKIGDDLYVTNMFDGLASLFGNYEFGEATQSDGNGGTETVNIRGAMRIKDYEDVTSAWGVAILNATIRDIAAGGGTLGDLGMVFKNANPALAILQILPLPGLGGIGKVLGLIDEVTNLAAAAMRIAKSMAWAAGVDPLVLDLDGDGIETIDFDDADTRVHFDDDGDFFRERTGWLDGDDGFLALDLNGNGVVDDISELFGGVGERGFAALSEHDDNADGVIDARDGVFTRLLVWQDRDSDGVSEAGELTALADHGIVSIDFGAAIDLGITTPQGVRLLAESTFTRADGTTGAALEALFERDDVDTVYRGESGLAPWLAGLGVDAKGFGRVTDLSVAMSNDFDLAAITAATAAAMTTPKLKTLVQQAGEALGAWGWSLDLTRELTPVLLGTDANGAVVLLDRGVWVEDAAGGWWTLASGAPVRDADGAAIARPSARGRISGSSPASRSGRACRPRSTRGSASRSRPASSRSGSSQTTGRAATSCGSST
jgi:hypothetical protein